MDMEPVIEELVTQEELNNFKDVNRPRKLLGYYFNCIECQKEGYLLNPKQIMCPRCGSPFLWDDLGDDRYPEPVYQEEEINKFSKLKHMIIIGPEVIVDEDPEEIINAIRSL